MVEDGDSRFLHNGLSTQQQCVIFPKPYLSNCLLLHANKVLQNMAAIVEEHKYEL